ncbi:MAG: DUF5009 domain-containing protein [Kiritimatiellae bacterium]|nr:DUF5009 domain-containing protein [Kiritimatiellia bacterium]
MRKFVQAVRRAIPSPAEYPEHRLFCLDLLRGIDMFLLVALHGILVAVGKLFDFPSWWSYHLSHPAWVGFSFWDMIMPLFIFMCGAAIPLAIGRRLDEGASRAAVWRHVLLRVLMLWFFGMLVQGRLATLDAMKISPYNNTLQTIAAGYLIAVVVLHLKSRAVRIVAPCVLALAYTLLLHFCGDYSETGNYANVFEMKVLRLLVPAGSSAFAIHNYTWFLTTLMFGAMTLCGMLATDVLRADWTPFKRAAVLFAYGGGLLVLGFAVEPWVPCIKHIFTLSFTAQAMGYCVIALAVLYVLTDILRLRRGTGVLLLYGQFALTAYMVSHFFRPAVKGIVDPVTQGVPHLLGKEHAAWMPLVTSVATALVLTAVLAVKRRLSTKES